MAMSTSGKVWETSNTRWVISAGSAGAVVETRAKRGQYPHLAFSCENKAGVPCLPVELYGVFSRAVRGEAHLDMAASPAMCGVEDVAGHCGHRRGALAECRCEILDRVKHPDRRLQFEEDVLKAILGRIPARSTFSFNLAIFASGRLLGEEILLFRLINELCRIGAQGTIKLSLIDHCYDSAIATGSPCKALRQLDYLDQFLTEIAMCLPTGLTIDGRVFRTSEEYVAAAGLDSSLRHDLLIGADIEDGVSAVDLIANGARSPSAMKPIVLVKAGAVPRICTVAYGTLAGCYAPVDKKPLPPPSKEGDGGCAVM